MRCRAAEEDEEEICIIKHSPGKFKSVDSTYRSISQQMRLFVYRPKHIIGYNRSGKGTENSVGLFQICFQRNTSFMS